MSLSFSPPSNSSASLSAPSCVHTWLVDLNTARACRHRSLSYAYLLPSTSHWLQLSSTTHRSNGGASCTPTVLCAHLVALVPGPRGPEMRRAGGLQRVASRARSASPPGQAAGGPERRGAFLGTAPPPAPATLEAVVRQSAARRRAPPPRLLCLLSLRCQQQGKLGLEGEGNLPGLPTDRQPSCRNCGRCWFGLGGARGRCPRLDTCPLGFAFSFAVFWFLPCPPPLRPCPPHFSKELRDKKAWVLLVSMMLFQDRNFGDIYGTVY